MWVETIDGAVNLEHVTQLMVQHAEGAEPGSYYQVGCWTKVGGYDVLEGLHTTKNGALQYINELIAQENHPLRVVNKENPNEQEDTQGEGPRRTD